MKNLTSFRTISISSILLLFNSACAPVINTTKNNLNENTLIDSIVEASYPYLEADLEKQINFKAYKSDIIKFLRNAYQTVSSSSGNSKVAAERISNLTDKSKNPNWIIILSSADISNITGFSSNTYILCWTLCDLKQINEKQCGVNPIGCLDAATQRPDMVSSWSAVSEYLPPPMFPFHHPDMIYSKSTVTPLAFKGFMRFHPK